MIKKFIKLSILSTSIYTTSILANTLETAGDIGQIALPAAALGAIYYHQDLPGFYQFAYASVATIGTVQILKHIVHRERPNGHDQSFPSGHTAAAFLGAGFLQMRYGWGYGAPAYLVAALTGYSRIASKNHWTTDVLAGAAIGIGSNLIFTHQFSKNVNFSPYVDLDRKETGLEVSTKL